MASKRSKRTKASAPASRRVTVTAKTEARWKNVRGRRGGLQDMLNMPMDVIQEICLYLHPRDLLSLSRTSKSFHKFLMQRSSAYLWKGSIKNIVDLPPCPKGWIESAWVSLIFSPYCTACGTGKAATVYWEFLARFCVRCRPQMVVAANRVDNILDCRQWEHFQSIPNDIFLEAEAVTGFRGPCYIQSQVFEAIDTYGKLYAARKWDSAAKLADKDIQRAQQFREHADLCQQWAEKEELRHIQEVRALINERLEEVTSRLRVLGWGAEDSTLLSQHKHVQVAKKLTNAVTWQNMKDELAECMEDIREERLEHEYMVLLAKRWPFLKSVATGFLDRYLGEHPEMLDYGLNIADLALSKEFRDIMCAPADEVVDRSRFLALEGQVDAIVERWRTRVCEELRTACTKHKLKVLLGVDPLDLATTLFAVNDNPRFSKSRFFPHIVAHSDLRSALPKSGKDTYEKFVYGLRDVHCYVAPDGLRPLTLPDRIRDIIRVCGKDPDVALAADMDALDLRLVNRYEAIKTWRRAMLETADLGPWPFRLASADETAKTKTLELSRLQRARLWSCARCETAHIPMVHNTVQEHLRDEHGVEHANLEDIKLNQNLVASVLAQSGTGILTSDLNDTKRYYDRDALRSHLW
ncbi:uncharacterized protein B0H18DRAFT_1002391 [Fomitopsis serialis]|uniref:uncharacterized protein n=1 Tax=Fomitopsis serialis TaxID=139415 RepID=UPI00200751A7|nr:uncharacterized protein B0H18DRAFT_1002391 [Neoantrodia serialis]KAH9927822.1 hypothetical protein B0H18DRAFT_1002391 [Neoantrodia serialis]